MSTGLHLETTFPTSWFTAQSEQFWAHDHQRQVHAQLLVGRPDGYTWEDVTGYLVRAEVELGDVSGIGTGATGADAVVRRMTFTVQNEGALIPAWSNTTAQDENYVVGGESDVVGRRQESATLFIDRLFGTHHKYLRDGFSPRDQSSAWNQFDGGFAPILKPNREVALRAAVTPIGQEPTALDWVTLFQGLIDSSSTSGPDVTVQCRDLAKRLMYTYIYEQEEFGDDDNPVPAATVIQQILNRYVKTATPQLYVPKQPPFRCGRFRTQYESVWDAIQKVAAQFGWFLGYRWVPSLGAFRLVLMEPPRLKNAGSADFVLSHVKNVYDHTDEMGDQYIGNLAVVRFTEAQTGERRTVVVRNEESIAEWEERAMEFSEGELSLIDTEEEAIALGVAAVTDCGGIIGSKRVIAPFLPTADVFTGAVIADPRISSTEDFMGVVSVRHVLDFDAKVFETELVGQSRVVGGDKKWRKMQTRPGVTPPVRTGDIEPEAIDPHRLAGPLTPDYQSVQIRKSQNAVVIRDQSGRDRTAFGNIQGYPWGIGQLKPNTYGMWGDEAGVYMRGYARLLDWGYAIDEEEIDISHEPNLANPDVILAPKEMLTYYPGDPSAAPLIYTEAIQTTPGKFVIKAKTILRGAFNPLPSGITSGNNRSGRWVQPRTAGISGNKGVVTNFFRCRVYWFAASLGTVHIWQDVTNEFNANGDPINWKRQRSFHRQAPLFGSLQGTLNWDLSLKTDEWAIRVRWENDNPVLVDNAISEVTSAGYRSDGYLNIRGELIGPDESSEMTVMYIAYDQG